MKKLLIFSALFLGIVISTGCKKEKDPNTLVLGTNAVYPPFEFVNYEGIVEGFDIDVAEAIAQKLGLTLVVQEAGFDTLIMNLKQEKNDIVLSGMSITPSRLKEVAMIPYQGEEIKNLVFAFWGEEKEIQTVAVQVGTWMDDYAHAVFDKNVKALEGNIAMIMDIQYGKSDATLFEPHIARAMKAQFPNLTLIEHSLPENYWVLGNGIALKKRNVKLIEKVEAAVKELKEEGVIQKLEEKWFGVSNDQ